MAVDKTYSKLKDLTSLFANTSIAEREVTISKIHRESEQQAQRVEDLIKFKIMQLSGFINVVRPITEEQRNAIVDLLISEYGNRLTLADVSLFFRMLMCGKFQTKILDRLDGQVIFSAMKEYMDRRLDALQHQKAVEHSKAKSMKPDNPDPKGLKLLAEVFKKALLKRKIKEINSRFEYKSLFHYCEVNEIPYADFMSRLNQDIKDDFKLMFETHEEYRDIEFEGFKDYILNRKLAELNKDLHSEGLTKKEGVCYKNGGACKYNCSGLCKDSY